MKLTIRPETIADHAAIQEVNRLAFGRVDEARLVDALRAGGHVRLSLVAESFGRVVGHILFSKLPIMTENGVVEALALAPMAVVPSQQQRGIGSLLVREGLRACAEARHRIIIVLGHPEFYPPLRLLSAAGRGAQVAVLGTGVHGRRVGAGCPGGSRGDGLLSAAVRCRLIFGENDGPDLPA